MAHDEGQALLTILSVQAALQEQGWGAVIDDWQAMVVATALGQKVSDAPVDIDAVTSRGRFAEAAAIRWRRLCNAMGAERDTPAGVLAVMERLGIIVPKRLVVARRWALADPVPDATTSPHLDRETQAAARLARHRHEVGMAIGDLLETGDGEHRAASRAALASQVGTDEETLAQLAGERAYAWEIVDEPDGGVVLRQIDDEELEEALAALEDLPDSAFGPD